MSIPTSGNNSFTGGPHAAQSHEIEDGDLPPVESLESLFETNRSNSSLFIPPKRIPMPKRSGNPTTPKGVPHKKTLQPRATRATLDSNGNSPSCAGRKSATPPPQPQGRTPPPGLAYDAFTLDLTPNGSFVQPEDKGLPAKDSLGSIGDVGDSVITSPSVDSKTPESTDSETDDTHDKGEKQFKFQQQFAQIIEDARKIREQQAATSANLAVEADNNKTSTAQAVGQLEDDIASSSSSTSGITSPDPVATTPVPATTLIYEQHNLLSNLKEIEAESRRKLERDNMLLTRRMSSEFRAAYSKIRLEQEQKKKTELLESAKNNRGKALLEKHNAERALEGAKIALESAGGILSKVQKEIITKYDFVDSDVNIIRIALGALLSRSGIERSQEVATAIDSLESAVKGVKAAEDIVNQKNIAVQGATDKFWGTDKTLRASEASLRSISVLESDGRRALPTSATSSQITKKIRQITQIKLITASFNHAVQAAFRQLNTPIVGNAASLSVEAATLDGSQLTELDTVFEQIIRVHVELYVSRRLLAATAAADDKEGWEKQAEHELNGFIDSISLEYGKLLAITTSLPGAREIVEYKDKIKVAYNEWEEEVKKLKLMENMAATLDDDVPQDLTAIWNRQIKDLIDVVMLIIKDKAKIEVLKKEKTLTAAMLAIKNAAESKERQILCEVTTVRTSLNNFMKEKKFSRAQILYVNNELNGASEDSDDPEVDFTESAIAMLTPKISKVVELMKKLDDAERALKQIKNEYEKLNKIIECCCPTD